MATTFGFGSYVAGNSPVHALDARVKVILTCAFSIAAFFVSTWPGMSALVALAFALYAIARLPLDRALGGLKPVLFILVVTVLAHALTFDVNAPAAVASAGSLGLEGAWALSGSFGVTADGLMRGLFFALRIALLVMSCCLLTFTTPVLELVDALTFFIAPLERLRVPVDDIALMVSMALRFIPTTVREAHLVTDAQKARCAAFDAGGPYARVRARAMTLVPLFVRLFRRADDLGRAMDARVYQGKGRTRRLSRSLAARDIVVAVLGVALLAALAVIA